MFVSKYLNSREKVWSRAILTKQYAASKTNRVPLKYTWASQAIVHAPRWVSSGGASFIFIFSFETSPPFLSLPPLLTSSELCSFFGCFWYGINVEWPVLATFGLTLATLEISPSPFPLFFRPLFCWGCRNFVLVWVFLGFSIFVPWFGEGFVTNSVTSGSER